LLFRLTATDTDGISSSGNIELFPDLTTFTLGTSPSGIGLLLDQLYVATPYNVESMIGYHHLITAPVAVCINNQHHDLTGWPKSVTGYVCCTLIDR